MSISTIFPRLTVKPMTENGCPPGSHEMIPAAPFTSTGRANSRSREKVSACSATARAPRSSLDAPGGRGHYHLPIVVFAQASRSGKGFNV